MLHILRAWKLKTEKRLEEVIHSQLYWCEQTNAWTPLCLHQSQRGAGSNLSIQTECTIWHLSKKVGVWFLSVIRQEPDVPSSRQTTSSETPFSSQNPKFQIHYRWPLNQPFFKHLVWLMCHLLVIPTVLFNIYLYICSLIMRCDVICRYGPTTLTTTVDASVSFFRLTNGTRMWW